MILLLVELLNHVVLKYVKRKKRNVRGATTVTALQKRGTNVLRRAARRGVILDGWYMTVNITMP